MLVKAGEMSPTDFEALADVIAARSDRLESVVFNMCLSDKAADRLYSKVGPRSSPHIHAWSTVTEDRAASLLSRLYVHYVVVEGCSPTAALAKARSRFGVDTERRVSVNVGGGGEGEGVDSSWFALCLRFHRTLRIAPILILRTESLSLAMRTI